jgi:hypothetical protein
MDLYADPEAKHPVPGGAASVMQVFLLPASSDAQSQDALAQLAVVNLASAFAAGHPSGLQTETLTIDSICATLRANLPHVAEVRFLVDGQTRPTLAGHVDLTRTYLTAQTVSAQGTKP